MIFTKAELRKQLQAKRKALPNKDELSDQVFKHLLTSSVYTQAATLLFYVDVRDEVRTQAALARVLQTNQRIAVPYCVKMSSGENTLRCVEIESMEDLEEGQFGILEPKHLLRMNSSRHIDPEHFDLVLVPGVGFDLRGGRLGHGAGYYDYFLSLTRAECLKIGVAYACQLVNQIPTEVHDVTMDMIVTESELLDLRQDGV